MRAQSVANAHVAHFTFGSVFTQPITLNPKSHGIIDSSGSCCSSSMMMSQGCQRVRTNLSQSSVILGIDNATIVVGCHGVDGVIAQRRIVARRRGNLSWRHGR